MDLTIRIPPVIHNESCLQLASSLKKGLANPANRVLVLEGSAGTFCSGLDLKYAAEGPDWETLERGVKLFAECLREIRLAPIPVIARVDGDVRGGGIGLICACDLTLATPRSRFALPELLFGLVPAVIWPFVAERLRPQQARRLALSGENIGAQQALELGLIDEIQPPERLERACSSWARRLLRAAPTAVRSLKNFSFNCSRQSLNEWFETAIPSTLEQLHDPVALSRIQRYLLGIAPWHSDFDEN